MSGRKVKMRGELRAPRGFTLCRFDEDSELFYPSPLRKCCDYCTLNYIRKYRAKIKQEWEREKPSVYPKFHRYNEDKSHFNGGKYESYAEYVERTKPWEG